MLVFITDRQPHSFVYRQGPSLSGSCCSHLELYTPAHHFCTLLACLPGTSQKSRLTFFLFPILVPDNVQCSGSDTSHFRHFNLTYHTHEERQDSDNYERFFIRMAASWLDYVTNNKQSDRHTKLQIKIIQKRIKLQCQQTEVYSLDIMVQTIMYERMFNSSRRRRNYESFLMSHEWVCEFTLSVTLPLILSPIHTADEMKLSSLVASVVCTQFATSWRRLPTDSVDNFETDQTP